MHYLISGNRDTNVPCIYYMGLPQELDETEKSLEGFLSTVVYVVIEDWDNMLTPWPAKGLYRSDPDFKGNASEFLERLLEELIPGIETDQGLQPSKRAIAGYSLAGLFSVYAFANADIFHCAASMSGSFWYEGWVDYIESLNLNKEGCSAFLTLGDKERKAKEKILHSVQDNTELTVKALNSWGVKTQYHLVPGGHFDHIYERVNEGLTALGAMMA